MEGGVIEDRKSGSTGWQFIVGVVSLLAVAIISLAVFRKGTGRSRRLPPGPRGLPVLGSLLALGLLPQRTFTAWAKQYGPLVFFRMGSMPAVVVSSSSMAKEFLKTYDQIWASRPNHMIPKVLSFGNDIAFQAYGPHWRHVRKVCTLELFTVLRVSQFEGARQTAVRSSLRFLHNASKQRSVLNMHHVLSSLASNVTTQMMWNKMHFVYEGDSVTPETMSEFPDIVLEQSNLLGSVNIGDYIPVLTPISMNLLGLGKRMNDVYLKMNKFLEDIINEHEKSEKKSSTANKDFVDILLEYRNSKESGPRDESLSRDTVKSILWVIMMAGTDSTATTVEWALAELLKNPAMMKKAQDELKANVEANRLVMDADIPSLKYIQAILKETLRLHPPAPLAIPHLSMEDCEVGGYFIPAGTQMFINLWAIHRDPESWENPMEFNPDRFLTRSVDVRGLDWELIPFGSGRRMCPGINLGLTMVLFILAQLLHTFSWTLVESNGDPVKCPEKLDMMESFGLACPKAVHLSVTCKPRLADQIIVPDLHQSQA